MSAAASGDDRRAERPVCLPGLDVHVRWTAAGAGGCGWSRASEPELGRYAAHDERGFVTPDDVVAVAAPVLRHRLLLRPEAELERYRPDDAVRAAIDAVAVPR